MGHRVNASRTLCARRLRMAESQCLPFAFDDHATALIAFQNHGK
jgi:hypothetical protein